MIKVSIIIPTRNRANDLRRVLASIDNNIATTNSFEVIVIDNGSTDDTKSICDACKISIQNFTYCYDDEPGLLTGRHHGATLASGEILCFLDDDVIINPKYIESVNWLFSKNKNINFATGPCLPQYEIEPPAWLAYFWDSVPEGKYCAWLSLLDFGNEIKTISPNYVWGLNFCCRKAVFYELGGFHPDCIPIHLQQFQGDGETGLTQKAIAQGMTARYDPGLSLKHHVSKERLSDEYFVKRAYYQGVCDSFTQLRNERIISTQSKPSRFKLLRNKLHPYYRWLKKKPLNNEALFPVFIQEMKKNLERSITKGYEFHQKHFHSNEQVKKWVIKENYWDYKLPI